MTYTIEPNDALSINGRNVICFDPSLQYNIQMVKGAGDISGGAATSHRGASISPQVGRAEYSA